jgi:hypothetical protein
MQGAELLDVEWTNRALVCSALNLLAPVPVGLARTRTRTFPRWLSSIAEGTEINAMATPPSSSLIGFEDHSRRRRS